MAVSLNSVNSFNPLSMQAIGSVTGCAVTKSLRLASPQVFIRLRTTKLNRRPSNLSATENDSVIADTGGNVSVEPVPASDTNRSTDSDRSAYTPSVGSSASAEQENNTSSSPDVQPTQKKPPLTARERLRAARVLSRYSESKPAKATVGRSVLDALRESEKGKKGLPAAPTNIFDDSKRGMPKAGLTWSFPGGFDLFVIAFSFVFISTVMFATTYFVWKVGAIHFNEN